MFESMKQKQKNLRNKKQMKKIKIKVGSAFIVYYLVYTQHIEGKKKKKRPIIKDKR